MIYQEWGFRESPFQTTPLPSSQVGVDLLVGRDKEIGFLQRRIGSAPKIATVEGLNGIGKTSVINVASYLLYKKHLDHGTGPLFIPCRTAFQLEPSQNLDDFIDHVLMEIAQTLIDRAKELNKEGLGADTMAIDRWLNSAQLSSYNVGIWVLSGGKQSETNTSEGFNRSGFRKHVTSILEEVFPREQGGGVICTIDNIELLRTSVIARSTLENLRDKLFILPGVRWVLAGAQGIVLGVAGSPRLEGYLHQPVEVGEIDIACADNILSSRSKVYARIKKTYLPLLAVDFGRLYELLKGNLRSVLSKADDYCQWIADRTKPISDDEKHSSFNKWLSDQARDALAAVQNDLRPRAFKVFDEAVSLGGVFSPGDFAKFGFRNVQAMRPQIRDLESAGLLVSSQDDTDKRRKTIQVTSKGYLVDYARRMSGQSENAE